MLSDTNPEVQRVQTELLCKTPPEQRLAKALSLTATVINLSRQTIAELNPDMGPRDLNLKCIEYYYGEELAKRVRNSLNQGRSDVAL